MTEKPSSYVPRSMGTEYGHHLEGPAADGRLRDELAAVARDHAMYPVSGSPDLYRCLCGQWETRGLHGDPWQAHLTDAVLAAVTPHIDAAKCGHEKWGCGCWDQGFATAERELVKPLRAEVQSLTAERDLAIAHDRQPYPTAFAYEQACKVLHEQRERAKHAEAEVERLARVLAELRRLIEELIGERDEARERAEQAEDRLDGQAWEDLTAEVERLRKLTAECSCGTTYATYEGPEPDCPVHGAVRAFNDACAELDVTRARAERAEAALAAAYSENKLLCEEVRCRVQVLIDADAEVERLRKQFREDARLIEEIIGERDAAQSVAADALESRQSAEAALMAANQRIQAVLDLLAPVDRWDLPRPAWITPTVAREIRRALDPPEPAGGERDA